MSRPPQNQEPPQERPGAILIAGPTASGKSALAFSALRRAELLGLAAFLVAADQVLVRREGARLLASPPPALAGQIELSGVGILAEPFLAEAELTLLVDLAEANRIERLPESGTATLLGVALPRLVLPAREAAFGADVLQRFAMHQR